MTTTQSSLRVVFATNRFVRISNISNTISIIIYIDGASIYETTDYKYKYVECKLFSTNRHITNNLFSNLREWEVRRISPLTLFAIKRRSKPFTIFDLMSELSIIVQNST